MKKIEKIENIEKVLSLYNTWTHSDIAFIKDLKWSSNDLVISFYSQVRENINGWPDMSKDFFEILISFKSVTDFNLHFNGMRLQQLSAFDILDISNRGLENINFQIKDDENDKFSFYCENIQINEVFSPHKLLLTLDFR